MSSIPASVLSVRSQSILSKIVGSAAQNSPLYNVWKYMFLCFDTPRPSGKEEVMREKVRPSLSLSLQLTSLFPFALRLTVNTAALSPR